MSRQTAINLLIVLAGAVTIFTVGGAIALGVFYLFNGYITPPEATQTNFWALISAIIVSVLIPAAGLAGRYIVLRFEQMIRQAKETAELAAQQSIQNNQKLAEIGATLSNGGGIGQHEANQKLDQLLSLQQRDPQSKTRVTDQSVTDAGMYIHKEGGNVDVK